MKSIPLIVNWHDASAPIYSAHFEPNGKRLATAGGDNNVRLWRIVEDGEDRSVEYLSTLSKHNQAVNVVRFAPKGEILASAGDDGNVLLWVPAESHHPQAAFGDDALEDKETWRVKHMCRSSGAEIYDLAWSPDGVYFIIGSMDNIARIYNAQTGQLIRQIAEHSHYVQGVAWDPLNEYVATQSSDRSVHIYSLRTKDGHFTLEQGPSRIANHARMDLPSRRVSSPAPPDISLRSQLSTESSFVGVESPRPSEPSTPTVQALPMNPPSTISHSRRSSFGSTTSMRRSASPAPSMPLPAVMPMEASPKPGHVLGAKNANLYANETLTSFFRRLTFTPDGSLLLTPAGQYSVPHTGVAEGSKTTYELINTVYIYTRGGINKPPIAHLPGHKKPSVVVKCSPILYTIREGRVKTETITIDTSSGEDSLAALPDPVMPAPTSHTQTSVERSPFLHPSDSGPTSTPKNLQITTDGPSTGPTMAFSLPYRIVYAVATQDSVLLYDTQQQTPLCIVSNLHCATFTDLTWSNDGSTLLMTSSDGFCSTLTFSPGELGEIYVSDASTSKPGIHTPAAISLSSQNTPVPTPTSSVAPPSPFPGLSHHRTFSNPAVQEQPAGIATAGSVRPSSPTRSNSTSSVATQSSLAPFLTNQNQNGNTTVISNPPLVAGNMPGVTAGSFVAPSPLNMTTPPQTPRSTASSVTGVPGSTGVAKRDAAAAGDEEATKESENVGQHTTPTDGTHVSKKRRIAPTLVGDLNK